MTRHQKRRRLATWISQLLGWNASRKAKLARTINAEPLEKRELMASDAFAALLGSAQPLDTTSFMSAPLVSSGTNNSDSVEDRLVAEGEPADDLVAFAKALAATTTKFYGADWCPFCNQQKALFQDGAQYLPFVEVTNADRTANSVATQNNITTYPTWVFPDGSRLEGVQTLATIAQKSGVAIPKSESVFFAELSNVSIGTRSPIHIPLDGYSPNNRPITYTVSSSNPNVVAASMESSSNRSMRITTEGYGDMVFELFEDKAPRATGRVITLAQQNFYDGLTFHRVADDGLGNPFVIQGGDPQGTGAGGSSLGNFDDQFNTDLLHNGSGVLSFAKSTDDTNNSQFFVTATSTRFLDFNHSVFGKLVEGESVRKGIQRTAVDANDKPQFTVTMSDVSIFQDTENAVMLLKPGTTTGTSTITVNASDDQGRQFSRTFVVTVVADSNNGTPFLNDIPALSATAGQALNYTLTSQDREGDAVTYSVSKIGSVNYTLNVNSQTGVVTITPPTGFTGSLQFRATVQQSATSTTSDKTDSQTVTVNVGGEASTLTIDLTNASDSGTSNTDNITNATSLVFSVGGTTSGATVEILNGSTVVGTATASSATTQVTVNASSLTGAQQFTARQTINSQVTTSSALSVTLDRTAPVQVSANAIPSSATVGTALNVNLSHPEEGSGITYAFENAPAGLAIDASTGVITWTPIASQVGNQTFTLKLTDTAGNVTSQNLSMNVIQNPKLRMRLNFVATDGTPITSVQTGQQFKVQVLLSDLRGGTAAQGAFSAYTDLTFDSSVISPITTNPITHVSPYTGSKSGTVSTGLIDELGALAGTEPLGSDERVLAEITFTALTTGTANLRLDPADQAFNETTLYGDSGALATSLIQYGSGTLTVGANFQVVNDTFNFDEDAAQQTLNVLNNDTASSGTTLTIVEVSTPSKGGTLTIASDGKSLNYKPAANVNGAETFTYTVANAANVRQTGTVTVQLTDINDPPVATNDTFTVIQDSTQNVLDVLVNDTRGVDPSTETLTVSQVGTGSAGGTISVGTSGLNVRYTPKAGFTGTETFTYTLSDGRGATATATATVTVNPSVPAPTATADSFPITEDAAEASFDVIANDVPSVTGNTLSLESVGTSSKGSTVSVGTDGKMKYKPAANFAGSETITYVVKQSNGGRATGTVTFTVSNVNDAPVATADTLTAVSTAATTTLNVLANDTDPDTSDTMTITTITQPPTGSGTLAIASDSKSVTYTPPSSTFEGNFSFSYTIRDAAGLTSTATANVKVESFTPRAIKGKVMLNSTQKLANINLTLTGTTSSGTAVNQSVTSGADGSYTFNSLAPGNYTLKRDALPFLNDSGAQVAITSAKTDGDFTNDLTVTGSLLSQHIDVRDFLGSSFLRSLTAVLKSNGTAQWVAPQGDWADLTSLSFQVNTSNLTINAAKTSASNLTATVPFTNALMSKTTSGDFHLYRLRGASTAFNLAAPSTPTNNSSNSSSNSSTPSGEGEGEAPVTGTNSALIAEGEGSATPSVTSGSSSSSTSSNSTSTSTGSVLQALLGSNSKLTGPTTQSNNSSSSSNDSSGNATSVDEAMKDVGTGLKTSVSNPLLSLLASSRAKRN